LGISALEGVIARRRDAEELKKNTAPTRGTRGLLSMRTISVAVPFQNSDAVFFFSSSASRRLAITPSSAEIPNR
jgi:hypothetical protein